MLDLPVVNYRERLERVIERLNGHAMLLLAQPQAYRNGTVESAWRQDAFFYYLTGFNEPEAALLILSNKSASEPRVLMFLRDKDPTAELWNGLRMGVASAKARLPIDDAFSISELWTKLPNLLGTSKGLYYSLGQSSDNDRRVIECLRKHRVNVARNAVGMMSLMDPSIVGGELRVIKNPKR